MSILGKNVHVEKRSDGTVKMLRHNQEPFTKEMAGLVVASSTGLAKEYLKRAQSDYNFDPEMLLTLDEQLDWKLNMEERNRLRFVEKKTVKNTGVVSYAQTFLGMPVWKAGISMRMFADSLKIISSQSSIHLKIELELPKIGKVTSNDKLRDFKEMYLTIKKDIADAEKLASNNISEIVKNTKAELVKITSTKPIIYQYDPMQRIDPEITDHKKNNGGNLPSLVLLPVPDNIKSGQHYVVIEVLFILKMPSWGEIHWRAMLELGTGSVLYLRAFIQASDGKVFRDDPVRITGDTALTPCSPATDLDPLRSDVELLGLTAPFGTNPQSLSGEYIEITDTDSPVIAPPTEAVGDDFNYSSVTDDFSAVNAYYHLDSLYRMTINDFGFSQTTYFAGTSFPIPTDHRGDSGNRNAWHHGSSTGTTKFRFGLLDPACPVGYATDRATVIHEFGHSCLQNNIGSGTFSWAHGFGDALGVVMSDPESIAPDRFMRSPFMNAGAGLRRHDRDVTLGWAWGGSMDVSGSSQRRQILSTTMFRAYRSTGGDDNSGNAARRLARRKFAARYMSYIMIGAVGTMNSTTPPTGPDQFATALIDFEQSNIDFDGHPGGAFHKVIRWAFEKQGLYQPAGAPTPVTSVGSPPAVDVYIDDGRNGEYEWRQNFWNTTDIWSSRSSDSSIGHEKPLLGITNYLFVRVKNRGTETANNILVKAYHCRPSTGLVWPDDWQAMDTSELTVGSLASGAEVIVGPFEWVPENEGHECLLASVSADGDTSNADTVNGSIPHWRLVPFDNNIGQRNVSPESADGDSLVASLDHRSFWINNPYNHTVTINIESILPTILSKNNWKIKFLNPGGKKFQLGPRDDRKIVFKILPGRAYNLSALDETGEDIDIHAMIDDNIIGGMTYRLDPKIKENLPERKPDEHGCCKPYSEKKCKTNWWLPSILAGLLVSVGFIPLIWSDMITLSNTILLIIIGIVLGVMIIISLLRQCWCDNNRC